jgi:Tol biopolymer transport system component
MMKCCPSWDHAFLKVLALCLVIGLASCGGSLWGGFGSGGFVTPPTQNLGASLNSSAADQEPSYSYDGRYLVFASDRLAQRSIYLYDMQQRRLVDLPGLNQPNTLQEQPDISADGRYIVYISEQLGKPDVFVYDRQTSEAKRLTENILAEVRHPTISGNGRFVAFESNRSGQWNIEIYDRGTGVDLSLPSGSAAPPKASPPSPSP